MSSYHQGIKNVSTFLFEVRVANLRDVVIANLTTDFSQLDNICNQYLDILDNDYQIYQTVETLLVSSDCLNSLPFNTTKFMHLREIIIEGSRWWNLTLRHIPVTVEKIDLSNAGNIPSDLFTGLEFYQQLREIAIDYEEIDSLKVSISDLPNLKKILFTYMFDRQIMSDEEIVDDKDRIMNSDFLRLIRHRVIWNSSNSDCQIELNLI